MGSEKRRLVYLVFGTDSAARSNGISVVRLTQNLPNFLDAYGRDGKHKVDAA